jgi:hypothetical protein
MAEAKMIEVVQAAIDHQGIDDTIRAVGQFEPRGQTGSLFAGGMLGSELGGAMGEVGDAVGLGVGSIAGMKANAASRGLPQQMLVGVSETTVYGFKERTRRKEPHTLVFRVPRAGLKVSVHQRVNVRVVELLDEETGSRIELEGSRLPLTHSKDVIDVLAE